MKPHTNLLTTLGKSFFLSKKTERLRSQSTLIRLDIDLEHKNNISSDTCDLPSGNGDTKIASHLYLCCVLVMYISTS